MALFSSLVSFWATIALLLYEPDSAFIVLAAAVVCVAVVPFVRIDMLPWLVTPPLAALTVWSFSAPGGYVWAFAAVVLCTALFAIVLLVRLTALRSRRPVTTGIRRAWLGSAVTGVAAVAVASTTIPLELRFRLSENAMTRTAQEVIEGKRDPATIKRIGLWNVRRAERMPGGMRFLVEGAGLFDSHGFQYPTNGRPPPNAKYFRSGWYFWTLDVEL